MAEGDRPAQRPAVEACDRLGLNFSAKQLIEDYGVENLHIGKQPMSASSSDFDDKSKLKIRMDIATSALREIAQAGLARVQTMCTSGWIHHELHVPSDASEADVPGLNDDPEVMNLPDGSITLDMEQADACFEDAAGISFAHGVIERIMIIDLYDQPAEGSVRTTLDHSSDAVTQHKAYRAYRATALAFVRMVISNPLEGKDAAVNGTQNWFEIRAGHQMHACLIFESNTRVDA
ncbi:hypothetical protein WJX77_009587 [Trebouxia sp. C0004]